MMVLSLTSTSCKAKLRKNLYVSFYSVQLRIPEYNLEKTF